MACRLCGASALAPALHLARVPGNISRMLLPEEVGRTPAMPLDVLQCARCGFAQLGRDLGATFYDDYLMTTSHSPQMQQFQAEQAAEFVQRYGLTGKRVIEVGCGDGAYLGRLAAAGAQPSGIEPSARFRAIAEQTPYPVFAGYVGVSQPVPGGPYDAFVTRQVFEHVPDLHDFLGGIRRSLTPGAAGLVEVPSLEQAFDGGRFYDFFPDHLNYYTARTLRLALELNGFVVDEVSRGMHGEYNVAWVRVAQEHGFPAVQAAAHAVVAQLQAVVADAQQRGQRVAVWGAGGKGTSVMSLAGGGGIAYVVDSDPHKHGRLTPVTHLEISPPSRLQTDPVDLVVITALAYRDEILRVLRHDIGYRGALAILGPSLEHVPALLTA